MRCFRGETSFYQAVVACPPSPFRVSPQPMEPKRTLLARLIKLNLDNVPRLLSEGFPVVRACGFPRRHNRRGG